MSSVAGLLKQRPEPKRDQYGRYLIGGKPYTRVTTFAESVGDRYNLERWQQRMVALGLVARQDLYAAVASTSSDDKTKIGKLCEQAIEAAKGTAGANLGTALHAFTERVDMGEELTIPAPWDADVAAYKAQLAAVGAVLDRDHVERIVVHHTLGVAGTFDRLLELPNLGLVVADLKTGGFLEWGTIAIQLALYANAEELFDPTTNTCGPMPKVNTETAVVIHLPVGQASCTLYTVDITAGWEMVRTVGTVRSWRKRKDLHAPLSSFEQPSAISAVDDPKLAEWRDWLVRRAEKLRDAGGLATLAEHWPAGVPTFKQSTSYDRAQLELIKTALTAAEAAHNVRPPNFDRDSLSAADLQAMLGRLQALPADLLSLVETQATGVVPPLHAPTFDVEHLAALEVIVADAERQHTERLLDTTVGDDADMRAAVIDHVHANPETDIVTVCSQLDSQQLVFVMSLEGWKLQPNLSTEPVDA